MNKRSCKECEMTFFGRIDKKFCTDGCRSQYHNRLKRQDQEVTRMVNNLLHKNWRILKQMNSQGRKVVERDLLLGNGFTFNYFTSERKSCNGDIYRCCYNLGYIHGEDELIHLRVFEH